MFVDYRTVNEFPEVLTSLRVRVPRILDDVELRQAGGCIGYAVKQLTGENATSDPYDVFRVAGTTTFTVNFGVEIWESEQEDFLDLVDTYLSEGSPIRTTNRSGSNTAGTRLVDGMGVRCVIEILMPESVLRHIEIKVNGLIAVSQEYMAEVGNENDALANFLIQYGTVLKGRR